MNFTNKRAAYTALLLLSLSHSSSFYAQQESTCASCFTFPNKSTINQLAHELYPYAGLLAYCIWIKPLVKEIKPWTEKDAVGITTNVSAVEKNKAFSDVVNTLVKVLFGALIFKHIKKHGDFIDAKVRAWLGIEEDNQQQPA